MCLTNNVWLGNAQLTTSKRGRKRLGSASRTTDVTGVITHSLPIAKAQDVFAGCLGKLSSNRCSGAGDGASTVACTCGEPPVTRKLCQRESQRGTNALVAETLLTSMKVATERTVSIKLSSTTSDE